MKVRKALGTSKVVRLSSCQVARLSRLIHGTCWTTFVFMSMLKSVRLSSLILGTCWTTLAFMSKVTIFRLSAMLFFYLSSSITHAPHMGCSAGRGWSFHSCQEIWIVYFLLPPLRGLKRSKTMLNGSRNWMRMRKAFWDPFNIVLLLLSPREPHTQFASRMETEVVVATPWLTVGIGLAHTTGVISCIYWHIS